MAVDEQLADRVRDALPPDATEKRMFGGLSFLLGGNLAVAVGGDELMVRVGLHGIAEALTLPGARPCVMGERTMRGWVLVGVDELVSDRSLADWVLRGATFAQTLPVT